jgi:ribosome-binding protein aMBF1 (putative translation factor)
MPKSSSPAPLAQQSSLSVPSNPRAKSLGIHAQTLPSGVSETRAQTPVSSRHARAFDSANFQAARDLLQARLDAGLSQEALAARTGEDVKTVAQRERGRVDLGPLRQLKILERAAGVKRVK